MGGAFIPLASPHLVAVADMHQRDTLPRNRSALRTQTTEGVVVVRLQVMKQRLGDAPFAARGRRTTRDRVRAPGSAGVGASGGAGLPDRAVAGLRRRRRRIFDAAPSAQQSADQSSMNMSSMRP